MSRTIVEEWHGVSGVSHPYPAGLCGRNAGSGNHPVSAAFARLLPGPFTRGIDNSQRSDGAPAICHRIAEPPGDAPIPHAQNSTAPTKIVPGPSFFSKSVPRGTSSVGGFHTPLTPCGGKRRSPKEGDLRLAPNNDQDSVRGSVLTCTTSRNLRPRAREGD